MILTENALPSPDSSDCEKHTVGLEAGVEELHINQ